MSDYQVTNYGCCGECQWSTYKAYEKAFVCGNERSDYYTDYIEYTDGCDEFEPKGVNL